MILDTERLNLREFQISDVDAVHLYASDPEVVRYMLFGPNSPEETKNYIQGQLSYQNSQPRRVYDLALVLKANNILVGACSINVSDPEHKEAFIGYILNKAYWNRGYMTEAASAVVQFGFSKLGLHRIFATCDPANTASFKLMEKVGMQREGLLREHKFIKTKWRDSLLYSILEYEWRVLRPSNFQ